MNEKLAQALEYISENKIAQAARANGKKRRRFRLVAAILAIAMLFNMPYISMPISAKAVSTASGTKIGERPTHGTEEYYTWRDARDVAWENAEDAVETLQPFFQESAAAYIAGTTENRVWSPVNAYISLAMLAEVTDGNSRQQILDLLNTADMDTLRAQVGGVWETLYQDDGNEICTLANSLWLNEDLRYNQETMDAVAYYHYASVYQKNLEKAGGALANWLNNNTSGLLKNNTANVSFPDQAVLALASTVYLQSKWVDEFSPGKNTDGIFHSPNGDKEVEFMNKKEYQANYYWGESFGAVHLFLQNGTKMWFFLPDTDKTVDDILTEGQYLEYVSHSYEDEDAVCKYMKVNLTVPKFDISSSADLSAMLKEMGITDVFDLEKSNFTAITADTPVYVTAVNQAARIIVDEQGVKAASYIEIPGAGAGMPPEEIIDFILDRPFLFVIADNNGIPVFTGVVNEP